MLCNTEPIGHSSYERVLLLYSCIVRKYIALGPNLICHGINYTLIKHLIVCLIKCKIIGKSLEHFCLKNNIALSALKDLVHAYPVVLQLYCKSGLLCFYQINSFQAVSLSPTALVSIPLLLLEQF